MSRSQTEHARQKTNSAVKAEQAARAYELRLAGATLREIGAELGICIATVHVRLRDHMAERVDPLAEQYREMLLDQLDDLTARAYKILNANHIVVQHGKIVRDEDGNPLKDHGPVLAAIDRLIKINERRGRLTGADAAVKVDAQVHTVDPADIELAQMINEAKARAMVEEARLKGEITHG